MAPKLERSSFGSLKNIGNDPGQGLCGSDGGQTVCDEDLTVCKKPVTASKSQNEQPEKKKERRKHPRVLLDLPIEYRVMGDPKAYGALVANGSEMGLLIKSVKDIPVGTNLNLAILFQTEYEIGNFEVSAQIVWKEADWREDWRGCQYGLKFVSIRRDDHLKLGELLRGRLNLSEIESNL